MLLSQATLAVVVCSLPDRVSIEFLEIVLFSSNIGGKTTWIAKTSLAQLLREFRRNSQGT